VWAGDGLAVSLFSESGDGFVSDVNELLPGDSSSPPSIDAPPAFVIFGMSASLPCSA